MLANKRGERHLARIIRGTGQTKSERDWCTLWRNKIGFLTQRCIKNLVKLVAYLGRCSGAGSYQKNKKKENQFYEK
jgi:hypothetical protein